MACGQPLGIHGNVALDSRHFLACVMAFVACRIRILHALRIHDQECAVSFASLFLANLVTHIFFKACSSRLTPSSSSSLHLGKVAGQRSPLAAGFEHIQHGAPHFVEIDRARLGLLAGALQHRANGCELLAGDVAGLFLCSHAVIVGERRGSRTSY